MNRYVRDVTAALGIALLGLTACGGGDGTVRASSGGAELLSADAVDAAVAVAMPAATGAAGCDAPEVENVPTPDETTTRALLIGDWFLCDKPSFFGTTDEIGLVIATDGHWAKLASDGAGHTVEMNGAANRGTWELIDTSLMNGPGNFQINYVGLDGLTRNSAVRIIAPAKLLLNNNGVFIARYVRTLIATR